MNPGRADAGAAADGVERNQPDAGRPVVRRPGLWLIGALCNLAVVALALSTQASLPWTLVLLLWLNTLLFAFARIAERAILAAFLMSFFLLLLGREITVDFFRYETNQAPPGQTEHLQLCLVLSLVGILAGALAVSTVRARRLRAPVSSQDMESDQNRNGTLLADPSIVRSLYWVTLALSLVSVTLRARYVLANGYLSYYTEFSDLEDASGSMYGLRRIEIMLPLMLTIYLGLFPPRRQVVAAATGWGAYLALSLLTGQRGTFVGGVVVILAYWIVRSRQEPPGAWRIGRRGRIVGAVAVPLIAATMAAVESARGVGAVASDAGGRNPILQLLYGQGVSSTVIRNAYTYADFIPKDWYTGEFLHSGLLARLLGYQVYHGNTVEHALHGGSFTHAFAYTLLGPQYLTGRGTGSSFIAEMFYDYGYLGVLAGGAVYGAICVWTCHLVKGQPLRNGLRLMIVSTLLWAPRGSATGFLSIWLTPSVVVGLAAVTVLSVMAALLREAAQINRPQQESAALRILRHSPT
ncbi:O-antigen polysaccharide polymerase Wzy family protein [Actinomyces sp.]|uniref:O-antigen polysaccharide polymerase Wzy family protein n=1 Tax=Actinomyces sp. TaxID=29317 RepID=UPI0026DAB480|nr:O-antigen polysaccharide polymerase Wzy family protein [Actinomyces sp.]MDO4899143.1 O-antigen polysaccharide polymerase Wzy family protein [Actinomyces sp.]